VKGDTEAKAHIATPSLVFDREEGRDPDVLLGREWLVTNGLGGYSSGTVRGIATRRHHGAFVPDLPAPYGRTMMIPRIDDEVQVGRRRVLLAGAEYADGRIEGRGHLHLEEFRLEGQMPVWRFEIDGCRLEKRVVMPHGQNTVYVRYAVLEGPSIRLRLRPFVVFRMHEAPLGESEAPPGVLALHRGRYEIHWGGDRPAMKMALRPHAGVFVLQDIVDRNVYYRIERERGYAHVEEQCSPGFFSVDAGPGTSIAFVASMESWESLEFGADPIIEAERHRIEGLLARADPRARQGMAARLVLAADQFIVFPVSRREEQVLADAAGHELRTVIAGYHWFTDWGRDTMIGLEGLTLCTGRHEEAKAILLTFSRYVRNGLIPNLFPEGRRSALYHTADATLWFFHALDRYEASTNDRDTLERLYPVLKSIIERHLEGTDFGIGVDRKDGLLRAGAEGYQLTWMDAKVDGWVVTPRRGKPVEIQALWYNALRLMAQWSEALHRPADRWGELAEHTRVSFNARFWYEPGTYLYDVVDSEGGDDHSLRPNQIFSVSLRHPILNPARWRPVVDAVTDRLLTPVGLRSLAHGHRDYKAAYFGDLRARDAAYHQGTVWAWLIGHYLDARRRVHADGDDANRILRGFDEHLREGAVGTISEIFDAEAPYRPRGCVAQAWSVAEVLRALCHA
jgi:predicted glycogen debranching enzyme